MMIPVTLMWKAEFDRIQYYAVDSLGEQLDAGVQEDSDLLEQSDVSLESGEDGEAAQFSSSDMRLLRSKDSVNWVQMCTTPIAATSDVQPLIEQISGVWSTNRDYTRFLAMVMKLSQSKEQDIPLVRFVFFHGSLWKCSCSFRIDQCIGTVVSEGGGGSATYAPRLDGCL